MRCDRQVYKAGGWASAQPHESDTSPGCPTFEALSPRSIHPLLVFSTAYERGTYPKQALACE